MGSDRVMLATPPFPRPSVPPFPRHVDAGVDAGCIKGRALSVGGVFLVSLWHETGRLGSGQRLLVVNWIADSG